MEQLVILLLIALISLINWLVKKSAALREARKLEEKAAGTGEAPKNAPPPPKLEQAEFEPSLRRLKEALGLPDDALAPPLPRRSAEKVLPAPALSEPLPPPLPEARPIALPRPIATARARAPFHEARRHRESHAGRSGSTGATPVAGPRVRQLLGSPEGLRDAVVLSEILGPPKCLRQSGPGLPI